MKREKLDDAVVDFDLQFVDGILFVKDALGQLFVRIKHRVHGLVNSALGKAAHPQEPLFQLVQIFFEVAFHGLCSLNLPQRCNPPISSQDHPKRPVM